MTTDDTEHSPKKLFHWTKSRHNIWWTEYKGRRWAINKFQGEWQFFVDEVIARGNLRTVKYAAETWILRRAGVLEKIQVLEPNRAKLHPVDTLWDDIDAE